MSAAPRPVPLSGQEHPNRLGETSIFDGFLDCILGLPFSHRIILVDLNGNQLFMAGRSSIVFLNVDGELPWLPAEF
jgi:hypothetical protein